MILFVGIGNYGKEYVNTRHNVGFSMVDKIIEKYNFIEDGKKFHSLCYIGYVDSKKIFIIKPQTYVNLSGISVSEISKFYKIQISNIYVFHDDMDIELGKVKYKIGGSSAGHNGIKNIDEMIGKNYNRIRIGIGRPQFKDDVINYVLNKFSLDEKNIIENTINKITENINLLLTNKNLFLTQISQK